jgi:hypothetical protein
LHEVDLKRATLVFDELLFVDPLSRDISDFPGQRRVTGQIGLRGVLDDNSRVPPFGPRHTADETLPAWYEVADTYERLRKNGIARLVFPAEHLAGWQETLKYAIVHDLSRGIAAEGFPSSRWAHMNFESSTRWRLHVSRIPIGLFDLHNDEATLRAIVEGPDEQLRADKNFVALTARDLKAKLSAIARALEDSRDDSIVLPVDLAYSLVLNQALLLCDALQAFPVTDDIGAHGSFVKKLAETYASRELWDRRIVAAPEMPDLYRVQFFILSVVSRLIPDEAFSRLDIEEVIAYRRANIDPPL